MGTHTVGTTRTMGTTHRPFRVPFFSTHGSGPYLCPLLFFCMANCFLNIQYQNGSFLDHCEQWRSRFFSFLRFHLFYNAPGFVQVRPFPFSSFSVSTPSTTHPEKAHTRLFPPFPFLLSTTHPEKAHTRLFPLFPFLLSTTHPEKAHTRLFPFFFRFFFQQRTRNKPTSIVFLFIRFFFQKRTWNKSRSVYSWRWFILRSLPGSPGSYTAPRSMRSKHTSLHLNKRSSAVQSSYQASASHAFYRLPKFAQLLVLCAPNTPPCNWLSRAVQSSNSRSLWWCLHMVMFACGGICMWWCLHVVVFHRLSRIVHSSLFFALQTHLPVPGQGREFCNTFSEKTERSMCP